MSRRAPPARPGIASLRRIARSALLALLAAAPPLALPARLAAAAEPDRPAPVIYRWVDENGIPHYTAQRDRIPSAVRGSAREVRPAEDSGTAPAPASPAASASRSAPEAPVPPVPLAPTAPLAPSAPAQDAWIGSDRGAAAAGTAASGAATGAAPGELRAPDRPADEARLVEPATAARSAQPSGGAGSELDQRIATLEAEIERDEEALKDFLAEAPAAGGASLADRPEFREIARRLPQRQADLRDLRDQRSRLGRP